MKKAATDRDIAYERENTSSANNLEVQRRLRTLVDLAISIGRRKGMFKSLPPLEKDKPEKWAGDKTGG